MEVYEPLTLPDLFLPSPHALESVIRWIPPTSKHWSGGIQYDVSCADVAVTSSPCISGAPAYTELTKSATFTQVTRGSRSFTIYAEVDCTPDRQFWAEAEAAARKAITQYGGSQMATTLWTGASGGAPVFPNLTTSGPIYSDTGDILLQPALSIISGAPLDLVEGLGRLEEAFGDCYPGIGVVHVPTVFAAEFGRRGMINHEPDGRVVTNQGNIVVFDDGYPINYGPNGVVPATGSAWIFMTSPIFGIRGPITTFTREESFDRDVNTLKMIAEQTVILGWECCLNGVLVTVGGDLAGEPFSALQAF